MNDNSDINMNLDMGLGERRRSDDEKRDRRCGC